MRRLRHLAERHGQWLTVDEADLDRAAAWFDRYGWSAVFFGRMVPVIRTLISVPAGLAEMALVRFVLVTSAGSALWVLLLTVAGYLLELQFELVEHWVNPVSNAVVIGLVLLYALARRPRLRPQGLGQDPEFWRGMRLRRGPRPSPVRATMATGGRWCSGFGLRFMVTPRTTSFGA